MGLLFAFTYHTNAQGSSVTRRFIHFHSTGAPADSNMASHPVIIAPAIEFNFSNAFSWGTCLQYNTQFKYFNLDSRLQWRYNGRTNIYLEYTNDYLEDGPHREKVFALKFNYRIN